MDVMASGSSYSQPESEVEDVSSVSVESNKQEEVGDNEEELKAMNLTTNTEASSETSDEEVSQGNHYDVSIRGVMAELLRMEEIVSDRKLVLRWCRLMMYKPYRQVFVALKGHREWLVDWLRYEPHEPPGFLKPPKS